MSGRIFVSYSRADQSFAMPLAKRLRGEGFDVWFDQLDIRAGSRWDREVQAALTAAAIVLVILSPASVASENVLDEISYALDHRKTLVPVRMADCDTPLRLARIQYVDFTGNFDQAFDRCLGELRRRLIHSTTLDVRPQLTARVMPNRTMSSGLNQPQQSGTIRLYRFAKWMDRFRSYSIFANDLKVGSIGNGAQVDLTVPSGSIALRAGVDWCGSPTLMLEVAPGGAINVEVLNEHSPWNAGLAMLKPSSYLTLRPLDHRQLAT